MKSLIPFIVILFSLSCTAPKPEPTPVNDSIYQLSSIQNLLHGLYESDVTLGDVEKQGDFGVGTFKHLNGEMILLDGVTYQVLVDGTVQKPKPSVTIPWATVKKFKADHELKMAGEFLYPEIQGEISRILKSRNYLYAIKIQGTFENAKLRSVPAQIPPKTLKLLDAVKEQKIFEHKTITGTMVGFRLPEYLMGLNATGYHFHFISDDHKAGGHVLDITLRKGTVQIDQSTKLELQLPTDSKFRKFPFEK